MFYFLYCIIAEEETKNLKDLLRELLEKIYNNIVPLIRSWVTIRNIEVLDSFIAYLVDQRLRKSGRIGEDKTYVDMFRFMSKFYIETYNIKNIKDKNKIKNRKSTRLNSRSLHKPRMPSSA